MAPNLRSLQMSRFSTKHRMRLFTSVGFVSKTWPGPQAVPDSGLIGKKLYVVAVFRQKASDISHSKSIFWPSFRTDSILPQMAMSTSSERSQWNKQTRFLNTNRCGFTLTDGWKQGVNLHVYVLSPFKQSTPRFWMMDENTAISTPRQNSSRAEGTHQTH